MIDNVNVHTRNQRFRSTDPHLPRSGRHLRLTFFIMEEVGPYARSDRRVWKDSRSNSEFQLMHYKLQRRNKQINSNVIFHVVLTFIKLQIEWIFAAVRGAR